MGSLGTADSASGRDNVGDIELLCNESRALVCMQPGVPEGLTGRWFILKDIVIPPTTLPSTEPYYIEFTAMDAKGHIDKVTLPVYVGGPDTEAALRESPKFLAVVPVDEDELEILLSAPIKTELVSRIGNQFIIQPTLNALSQLKVRSVSWDTTGRLLYVQTDPLNPGETYTFGIAPPGNANITPLLDVYGNRFSRDQGGSLAFTAFRRPGVPPKIEKITLVDATHIDVHFNAPVLPSSVHTDLLPVKALLRSVTTGEQKLVKGGTLQDQARVLRLTVESLREGERYLLRIAGILAPGPTEAPAPGAEKSFIALFPREGEQEAFTILPTADLNADGKVDFADFALFSAVYGTEYDPEEARDLPPPGFVSGGGSDSRTDSTRNAAPPEDSFGGDLPPLQF